MSGEAMPTALGGRLVRAALLVAACGAVVAVIVGVAVGHVGPSAAIAIGLLLGSVNGLIAGRMIRMPVPFVASSLLRLFTLSMIGAAIGYTLGVGNIWLVILGIGAAQMLLAASALRELMAQR
jgi:hypothetical protein